MTPEQEEQLRRQFLKEVTNFLELSSEIQRNKRDAEFREHGGQIIYCFDATVFNMFFDTNEWKYAVQTFNGSPWSNSDPVHWENIQTQSAIVAAEYLLADGLPGAKQNKIFLSPWHFDELSKSVEFVCKSLADTSPKGQTRKKAIEKELKRKGDFLSLSSDNERAKFDGSDEDLETDVEQLRLAFHDLPLDRYQATRKAATLLVESENSERFDQIHRILSAEVQDKLGNLVDLFDARDLDISTLRTDAVNWYYRLSNRFAQRDAAKKEKGIKSGGRSRTGIWSDARTLALCQYVSDKLLSDNQRIAFVTSDKQLFLAYSEWWATAHPSQEFVLRQSIQFTPIFNFSDVSSDLKTSHGSSIKVEAIFKKIEEAVETTLLPFNLSKVSKFSERYEPDIQYRGREHLAAYVRSHGYTDDDPVLELFLRGVKPEWLQTKLQDFKDTSDLWRKLERVSVGFFSQLVNKRLEDDGLSIGIFGKYENSDRYSKSAIEFLSRSLDAITSSIRSNSIPIALKYLGENVETAAINQRRVPATIWYKIHDQFIVNDMFHNFENKKKDEEFESALLRKPEANFVLAAGAALHVRDWWEAVKFAEQAVATSETHELHDKTLVEVLFLASAALRFKFGSFPSFSQRFEDPRNRERLRDSCFDKATGLLRHCEKIETMLEGRCLSKARIKAELGALNLFRATSLVVQSEYEIKADSAEPALASAERLLNEGLKLLPNLEDVKQVDFYRAVKLHILHNLAGVEVLRFLQDPKGFNRSSTIHEIIKNDVNELEADANCVPGLASEWITFCLIYGFEDLNSLSKLEKSLAASKKDNSLPLDRELAILISRNISAITNFLQEVSVKGYNSR